jgi:hypothetical protein
MATLAKWQAALNAALRQGRENPIDIAIRILETALTDVLQTLERMAEDEEWPLAKKLEKIEEVQAHVEALLSTAQASRRDSALAA